MEDNFGNTNPSNGKNAHADLDGLDESALREVLIRTRTEKTEFENKNRQLFERAKTAEGFEKLADGSWVKTEKKSSKPSKESEPKTDEFGLLQKTYLRAVGVSAEDEIELAKDIQKKTGLDWDKLVDDDYFKLKLEGLRETKANALATSNIKGGGGESQTKFTPQYWIAKGTPPSRADVPDRKTRAKIARAMMVNAKSGGKQFYNE